MKRTQREQVYSQIRQKLLDGSLAAGARLSPAALAAELGISSTPVREAISQLESEGLVEHLPHRGAFVKESDREELVDLMEMWTLVECHAAAKAAVRIGPAQLKEFDAAWEELRSVAADCRGCSADNNAEFLRRWNGPDLRFHTILVQATGNRHMLRTVEDLRIMTRSFGAWHDAPSVWADPVKYFTQSLQIHKAIHEAIRRHDPKAARKAMGIHMRETRKRLLRRYDWLRRQGRIADTQSAKGTLAAES